LGDIWFVLLIGAGVVLAEYVYAVTGYATPGLVSK
jgi:hypothetical protein